MSEEKPRFTAGAVERRAGCYAGAGIDDSRGPAGIHYMRITCYGNAGWCNKGDGDVAGAVALRDEVLQALQMREDMKGVLAEVYRQGRQDVLRELLKARLESYGTIKRVRELVAAELGEDMP